MCAKGSSEFKNECACLLLCLFESTMYLSLAYSVLFSYPNLSLTESSANNSMFINALNDLHIIAPFSDIRL